MTRRTFSGRDIAKALHKMGYKRTGGSGSHRKFTYRHPDTGNVRTVIVPMTDPIPQGTLRKIAKQCGANDFDKWCRWIDKHC